MAVLVFLARAAGAGGVTRYPAPSGLVVLVEPPVGRRQHLASRVELAATGEFLTAARAQTLGLVNRVTSPELVQSETMMLAQGEPADNASGRQELIEHIVNRYIDAV